MNISYDAYRVFCQVADCGNMTRAAEIMLSNQPNVTRTIHNLESALGCRLLIRTNRGVTLTPEGEKLYARAKVACEQLRQAEAELAQSDSLRGGAVSVGVSEIALHAVLLSTLERFHQAYPEVRIRLSNHATPDAVEALSLGQVDLALVTTPTGVRSPLTQRPLTSFREVLVGGPTFARLTKETHSLRALSQEPMIGLGRGTGTFALYSEWYSSLGLPYELDLEAATADQILPMVRSNLGLGFLPEFFIREPLSRGEVLILPVAEPLPVRQVCLVKDARRSLSPAAALLEKELSVRSPSGRTLP